ncbi:MAG: hypothetical protein GY786_08470 [Proteobacteria bacterium]|nr:hypothetical protein [Pseudomonadota bacterium]
MKIWALSDIHYPAGAVNRMEPLGPIWIDHIAQIDHHWGDTVGREDIILLGGDLSWATKEERGLEALRHFSELPGLKKVIIPGNHDVWWQSNSSIKNRFPKDIIPLYGQAVKINETVICGSKGWLAPNDPCFDNLDHKPFKKEYDILKRALDEAMNLDPVEGIHLMLHFPPFTTKGLKTRFFELIKQYPVITCIYGHFHMQEEWKLIPKGCVDGIQCFLTSTDYLEHQPVLVHQPSQ